MCDIPIIAHGAAEGGGRGINLANPVCAASRLVRYTVYST